MSGGKNRDIVEEVFSRSMEADEKVSALFTRIKYPAQIRLEEDGKNAPDLMASPAVRDIGGSGDEVSGWGSGAEQESRRERTIGNRKLSGPVRAVAAAGLAVVAAALLVGGYLVRQGDASTGMIGQEQYVSRAETVSLSEQPQSVDVRAESVLEKIGEESAALEWRGVVKWSRLLGEISATMPTTVQLVVIESGDGSEMFLECRAFSAEAVYSFVDALITNTQIESAELGESGIGKVEAQELLTFCINCRVVSDTEAGGGVDGDYVGSGFDRSRLFTPEGAEKFFGDIQPVSADTDCVVKSWLVSQNDAVFEDEETGGSIVKRHAVLTLLGGYQNILEAVDKLQDRSQGVWVDSASIKQGGGGGGLECSMGISVYVAEGT